MKCSIYKHIYKHKGKWLVENSSNVAYNEGILGLADVFTLPG